MRELSHSKAFFEEGDQEEGHISNIEEMCDFTLI